mmetsp:Transcript_8997/g.14870  ORF Transcript_8997/g.14870 Transcript_8997/m.14870 type:complete len:347 (-) Transcript_8997:726-1766(-)
MEIQKQAPIYQLGDFGSVDSCPARTGNDRDPMCSSIQSTTLNQSWRVQRCADPSGGSLSRTSIMATSLFIASILLIESAMPAHAFVSIPHRRGQISATRYDSKISARSSDSAHGNEEEEEEDPIFNDSLIYGMPERLDFGGEAAPRQKHHTNGSEVDAGMDLLISRIRKMLVIERAENQLNRPPRNDLDPIELVEEILSALSTPDYPLPDSGLGVLYRSSTREWRAKMRESIGAPKEAECSDIARALANAISRERNQFGILVGADDSEKYVASFPSDIVDHNDGFCFLECQLRSAEDNTLLVATGWQLKRSQRLDGAWLIDRIDWQDFRNLYRPGIGREEWLRSVG